MKKIVTPRVFISYSHDEATWEALAGDPLVQSKRVYVLYDRLRGDGIDCKIDQEEISPIVKWPRWMMNQIEEAEFVLVVASEHYNLRFRAHERVQGGSGAQWEGAIITQDLYESDGQDGKYLPIVFDVGDIDHIPKPLKGATYFNVSKQQDYEKLRDHLLGKTPTIPPLGKNKRRGKADP